METLELPYQSLPGKLDIAGPIPGKKSIKYYRNLYRKVVSKYLEEHLLWYRPKEELIIINYTEESGGFGFNFDLEPMLVVLAFHLRVRFIFKKTLYHNDIKAIKTLVIVGYKYDCHLSFHLLTYTQLFLRNAGIGMGIGARSYHRYRALINNYCNLLIRIFDSKGYLLSAEEDEAIRLQILRYLRTRIRRYREQLDVPVRKGRRAVQTARRREIRGFRRIYNRPAKPYIVEDKEIGQGDLLSGSL
jgi:hypothetical protein